MQVLSGVKLAELRVEVYSSHHHFLRERYKQASILRDLWLLSKCVIKVLELLLNGIMSSMAQFNRNELRTVCFSFE